MDVKDKFVLVGVSAKGIMPQIAMPVGLLYPHEVQAAMVESLTVDQIPGASLLYELLILVGCLILTIIIIRSYLLGTMWVGCLYTSVAIAAVWFVRNNILIDFSYSAVQGTYIIQEFC